MGILIPGFIILALFGGFLILENGRLARLRSRIPLRICVAGIRGKSTVTRQIAAALRASGRSVMAKTTGSKPMLILPEGGEREILRLGPPTVLEQKRVLSLAARSAADTLVAEMMSIGPECLAVESGMIFRPQILVMTNIRLDHEEELGRTVEAVAESLAAAIPPRSTVFLCTAKWYPVFDRVARKKKSRIIHLSPDEAENVLPGVDFPDNIRLSLAVAAHLGMDRESALKGIAAANPDFGSLRIWSMISPVSGRNWHFTSIFAANEPESTRIVLDRVRSRVPFEGRRMIALLNLRSDRASRTRQWLEAVRNGFFSGFDRVVFVGEQASALGRMRFPRGEGIPAVGAIKARSAGKLTDALWLLSAEETVVVGVGNIAGIGGDLVAYWEAAGMRVSC